MVVDNDIDNLSNPFHNTPPPMLKKWVQANQKPKTEHGKTQKEKE